MMRTTIEMAREAAGDDWGLFQEFMPEIHRLAELVRADERARMAEQPAQQEPVATKLHEAKQNFERNFWPHAMADWIYSDLLEWLNDTPPPAQRKPLTDEEIEEIAARTLFPVAFARAIEAKLNEKNT